MGGTKNRYLAKRRLLTAEEDLAVAKTLYDNDMFAVACFHAQQAAEKAMKAFLAWHDHEFSDAGPGAEEGGVENRKVQP